MTMPASVSAGAMVPVSASEPASDVLQLCQAEVEHLHLSFVGHDDVGRFDVTVHDASRVRGGESGRDLRGVADDVRERQSGGRDESIERMARYALHHQIVGAVVARREVVQGNDVRDD